MRVSSAPPARTWKVYLRLVFCVAWIAAQGALVLTAPRRADAAFGFRMFAESSTITVRLAREIEAPSGHGTVVVPVKNGEWTARGPDDKPHAIRWRDRVLESNLGRFDVPMHAAYSAAAQVERWHAALEDVAAHLGDDAETLSLHLDLTVSRNGREPVGYHFTSAARNAVAARGAPPR
jgi:hypothetical protein